MLFQCNAFKLKLNKTLKCAMHNDLRMGFKDLLYELDTKTVIIIRIKWYFIVRLETVMRALYQRCLNFISPNYIYPLHIQCGGTRLCIRLSLLCEPVSLRVAIATSCDAVSSRNRQDKLYCYWIVYCKSKLSSYCLYHYHPLA